MKEQWGIWRIIWFEMSKSFVWFWSILLGFVGLGITFSVWYDPEEVIFVTNVAMYIYFFVIGAQLFKLGITYGSTMGSTRHQLYTGVVISAIILAAVGTIIHMVVYYSMGMLTGSLTNGMKILHILEWLPVEEMIFSVVLFDFVVSLMALGVSFAFSIVYYRYGGIPFMILSGIIALSVIFPVGREMFWGEVIYWVMTGGTLELFGLPIAIAVLAFTAPYLFVTRLNIYLKENASAK
ncbi:hypothetical protein ACFPU1_04040 [Thalassorhabdus alkalitolerans]|uniref:ABC transporter permease n=1 Tax=Thalassorhabdus alkalitolerans TaxID=2282697 RepID=A0ABW0YHZ4_9BACI|nr:hypothetical protein [Thalassobacillus sp. C254]